MSQQDELFFLQEKLRNIRAIVTKVSMPDGLLSEIVRICDAQPSHECWADVAASDAHKAGQER